MVLDKQVREGITAAFRFVVSLDGTAMAAFSECKLPDLELNVEEVKEGGLNTYVHLLPGQRKPGRITLKNGVGVTKDLNEWYTQAMSEQFTRKRVSISLLNSKLESIMTLDFQNAIPVKWSGPTLKSDENTTAIQTLELVVGEVSIS
jgi:phage tail-like protein